MAAAKATGPAPWRAAGRCAPRRPAPPPIANSTSACAAGHQRPGWPTSARAANGSGGRRRGSPCGATDFHQSLLTATEAEHALPPLPALVVREAQADDELQAAAWLRALSFYRYPEERKFAAQVHRVMVAEEEYKELKVALVQRRLGRQPAGERSACLVALCPAAELAGGGGGDGDEPERLLVQGSGGGEARGGGSSAGGSQQRHAEAALAAAGQAAVVGTLDLYAVRALQGEVLIGDSRNAAYLANVCTAAAARRRGVGAALLAEARRLAAGWGVDALYVHTMAVNEIAVRFYERHGFVVEKEESSNTAHYRGRCLDGIEGRGRTVLMRDTRLHG